MTKSIQIVFLIDINNFFLSETIGIENPVKAIRLMCLKILTHFSNNEFRGKDNVKWGYKFFDSLNCHSVNQKCDFKDFKLDVFEEFENEVMIRTEKQYLLLQKYEQQKESRDFESGSKETTFPSESINTALKDLLCDFQWDRPDIISPVRSKRRSRMKPTYNEPDTNKRNIVFLITKSPVSREDMVSYFGVDVSKSVDLPSFLLGRLMSKTVLNNYINISKVNVFWIDTCSLEPSWITKKNFDGYISLENVLKRLNGNLIPLTCLVQSETWSSSLISNGILQGLLPTATILRWYLNFPSDVKHCIYALRLSGITTETIGNFYLYLHLFSPNVFHYFLGNYESFTFDVHLIPFEMKTVYPVDTEDKLVKVIDVIGTVSSKQINQQTIASFACLACDPCVFPGLLLYLINTRQSLVVKMDGVMGLLRPMTSTTATLLMIIPELDNSAFEDDVLLKLTNEFMHDFVLNNINRCIDEAIQIKNSEVKDDHIKTVPENDFNHHRFTPNMLERWYSSNYKDLSSIQKVKQKQLAYYGKEANILKKLQQLYKPALPLPLEKLSAKSEICTKDAYQVKSSNLNVSQRVTNLVSQSQILITQSKEEEMKKENLYHQLEVDEQNCRSRQRQMRLQTIEKQTTEVSDEKELLKILNSHYEEAIDSGINLLTCAESIVNTIIFHCKASYLSNSQEEAKKILEENFFRTTSFISELYQNADSSSEAKRINEYKLQVLLQLESLTVIPDVFNQAKCVNDVISHLRSLSLYSNPLSVKQFLEDIILDNYRLTLKEVLQEIYEELDQPVPALLASIKFSDTDSVNTYSSEFSQVDSYPLSSDSQNKNCLSARNRILSRQASFHDNSSKRQITVPVIHKFQDRNQSGTVKEIESLESKKCNVMLKEAKRVRRNLFESQSSSNKQNIHKHKRKEQIRTPKGQHVLKTRAVNETPVHKQVNNPLLSKREKFFRQRSRILSDVGVIEESPERNVLRRSPRQHSSTLKQNHSFYSASAKSRNLEKASSLMEIQDESIKPSVKTQLFPVDDISLPTEYTILQMTPVKTTQEKLKIESESITSFKDNEIPLKLSIKKCHSEEISISSSNKETSQLFLKPSKSQDYLSSSKLIYGNPAETVNQSVKVQRRNIIKKCPDVKETEKSPIFKKQSPSKIKLNTEKIIDAVDFYVVEEPQHQNPILLNNNNDKKHTETITVTRDGVESSFSKLYSKEEKSSSDISSSDNMVSDGKLVANLQKYGCSLTSLKVSLRRLDLSQHMSTAVDEKNRLKCSKLEKDNNLSSSDDENSCLNISKSTKVAFKRQSNKIADNPEIYSQRFTRRTSKVMNLSLETFNELSVMSPDKDSPKHQNNPRKRRNLNDSDVLSKKQCITYPYVSADNFLDNTVENICQGYNFYISPQKSELSTHLTPRRSQKYTSPSALSLLHLTTSPMINNPSSSISEPLESGHFKSFSSDLK